MENPFTFEFFLKEVDFYGQIEPKQVGNVKLDLVQISGPLRDYFNKNWYTIPLPVPRLVIDGKVWMSITPMEVQSMFLPIYAASYDVYTAGLGLGYYPLRVAAKKEIDNVYVYETNPVIIDWFLEQFKDRPELEKITIYNKDFLQVLRDEEIDPEEHIFSDIYQAINSSEALDHLEEFFPIYQGYTFWGMEKLILDTLNSGLHPGFLVPMYQEFFSHWFDTDISEATGDSAVKEVPLSDLYQPSWTYEDCLRFVEIWG